MNINMFLHAIFFWIREKRISIDLFGMDRDQIKTDCVTHQTVINLKIFKQPSQPVFYSFKPIMLYEIAYGKRECDFQI